MSLKNVLARIDICLPTLILLIHDTLISKFCFICERHKGKKIERDRNVYRHNAAEATGKFRFCWIGNFVVVGLHCAGGTDTGFAEPLDRNTGNELCFRNLSPVFPRIFNSVAQDCLPASVPLSRGEFVYGDLL
jgi:hypothetical protein